MRPSELYHLSDDYEAYCFDRAVTTFGLAVDNALEAAGRGAKNDKQAQRKRQNELNKWLGIAPKFKDPGAAPAAPVKEPESDVDSEKATGVVTL